jgi:hypothetical protein
MFQVSVWVSLRVILPLAAIAIIGTRMPNIRLDPNQTEHVFWPTASFGRKRLKDKEHSVGDPEYAGPIDG